MGNDSVLTGICPLFGFQISEILYGNYTPEEARKRFHDMRTRFEQGFEALGNVRIKRISRENLERFGKSGFGNLLMQEVPRESLGPNTFILEILSNKEVLEKDLERIYRVLLALRLYKEGNVFCKVMWFEENEEVKSMTTIDAPVPVPGSGYSIDVGDIEEIQKLTRRIEQIDFDKRKTLRIACERFNRSYEEHREDDKIIDFMIAFESLFKPQKRVANIGSLIGLGCSMLIGKDDHEREKINDFLVKAYDIRNKIVHGSEFILEIQSYAQSYSMENFLLQLRRYLVESIKKLI